MKPINPDVSHDYKYTSDYREIPIEYLNPRMPKGRVIFKWQAFIICTNLIKNLI